MIASSPEKSPIKSQAKEDSITTDDIKMAASQNTTPLPPKWNDNTSAERDTIIYNLLIENKTIIAGLVTNISEISTIVSEHTARLDTVDDNWRKHELELRDLRELHRAAPGPELKINGIPLSYTDPVLNLSDNLLDCLGLLALKSEVKTMRLFVPKITDGSPAQQPQHSANRRVAPAINLFFMELSSCDIGLSVLQKKKQHGKIVFSEIMPDGPDNDITIFEMLPQFTYKLRQSTREVANNHGYKHVWVSNGTVFVRKNNNPEILRILTTTDLAKIK